MEDIRSSKKELIEKICMESWKELYRFIYYKVQNREEAEDITQETYAKILAYCDKNNVPIKEYSSYLKTVSMNIIRDRWRSGKKKGKTLTLEDAEPEALANEDFTELVNERELLKEAMAKLTNEQRTVITLRIIEGYSSRETAKLMKKKESTVRVIQYRAVKALSELLSDQKGRK